MTVDLPSMDSEIHEKRLEAVIRIETVSDER